MLGILGTLLVPAAFFGALAAFWGFFYGIATTILNFLAPSVALPWWAPILVTLLFIGAVMAFSVKSMWNHPFITCGVAIGALLIWYVVLPKVPEIWHWIQHNLLGAVGIWL